LVVNPWALPVKELAFVWILLVSAHPCSFKAWIADLRDLGVGELLVGVCLKVVSFFKLDHLRFAFVHFSDFRHHPVGWSISMLKHSLRLLNILERFQIPRPFFFLLPYYFECIFKLICCVLDVRHAHKR
jgi:hypothetical protein